MNPIVSPWIIYLMGIVDNIRDACIVVLIFSSMALVVAAVGYYVNLYDEDEKGIEMSKRFIRKSLPTVVLCILILLFVPARNTIVGMIVAENLTYDRVEKLVDTGAGSLDAVRQALKQDVIDIIEAIQDGGSKKGERQ